MFLPPATHTRRPGIILDIEGSVRQKHKRAPFP